MFRPEEMRKATIYALNSDRDALFSRLHSQKVIQLTELSSESNGLSKRPPADELRGSSDLLLRVSRLVHICKLASVKLPFPQEMFGLDILKKQKVSERTDEQQLKSSQSILDKIETALLKLEQTHADALERLEEQIQLKARIETLLESGLDPLLIRDTEHVTIMSGIMPILSLGKLESDIDEETDGYGFVLSKQHDPKETIVIVGVLQEHATKLNFLLKKHNVQSFTLPELPKVKDLGKWMNNQIKSTEDTIKQSLSEIKRFRQKHFERLVVEREQLEIIKHKLESMHKLYGTQNFFVLEGWVQKSRVIELSKELFEATEGRVIVDYSLPTKDDEPPIQLTNPAWLKPFEILTELYALPKYGDLDPTFILGPIFLIFAGFMLTDFGYGLGLAALGLVMIFYFSKFSPGIKDMAISLTGIGVFSMIFGVLTGSYLGDSLSYFIGKSTEELAIWKDPLADPLYFLIISIIVALVHINFALVLGLLEDIRKKDYKAMLKNRIVWWLIQLSIALIYFQVAPLAGKILLGLTLLIILVMSGPLGILGVTGFMGDVISYSRLFALALSTAGIAMTVNLLADLLYGIPYVGFLLAAIIFIAGHLFSFAMNALGGFVHSIRLQFVEFFSKFYEGGGDRFEPFSEERYYTEKE